MIRTNKKIEFEMLNISSSSFLIKQISKFLIDSKALEYGSYGIIKIDVEYEKFDER